MKKRMARRLAAWIAIWFAVQPEIVAAQALGSGARQVLMQALQASDGRATGVLTGAIREQWVSTTKSSAPLVAEVTTLRDLGNGCKQLNMRLSQDNVPTIEGKPTQFGVNYQINVCPDRSTGG